MQTLTCDQCGAPYEQVKKFNGGNPMLVNYPTCNCDEERIDAETEAWVKRFEARKAREKLLSSDPQKEA